MTPVITMTAATTNSLFSGIERVASGGISSLNKAAGPQAWLSRTLDSTGMVALVIGALLVFLGLYLA
jgi:hypothetical protein